MSKDNRKTGTSFEETAEDYLRKKGYDIIKKNFHFGRHGEIDIVAEKDDCLVFVEVKGRKSQKYGSAINSISYSKRRKLRRAAEGYLYVNKIANKDCRMDLIAIDIINGKEEITHLENAF